MRLRTRGVLAALPLAFALALTGCGGDGEDGAGVASAGGEAAGAGASSRPSLGPEEMGVKFAQCMRENGVQMEDPKPGGGLKLNAKGVDKATMEKAQEACRELNPMAQGGGAPSAEDQERARKHAECMRENGVEAFPDPKPNQRGIRIDAEVGEDPDLEDAQQKCQELLQGARKGGPQ
ncbi:hypothetical protein [Actinomadura sp. WAC 06369]|uniref:hypothetical protein n=1 Tax=Actinomadura sp. WAC 06369 TaxID=2203193 RepID=UPI000F769E72|nr:hypothetical protein [Actinomadura sp. WAC 06369]RSN51550.1 hypothetical protein DMH08_30345 [Actinomadura sp. WAC 06369]